MRSFSFTILILLTLLVVCPVVAVDTLPADFMQLSPPITPKVTIYAKIADAQTNIAVVDNASAYEGKQAFLQASNAPGEEGFYAAYTIDVVGDKPAPYHLMAGCQPVGQPYTSPTELYLDGKLVKRYDSAPAGEKGWGISNAMRWVSFGQLMLSPGKHEIRFVVREKRSMDPTYCQSYDVIALLSEEPVSAFVQLESTGVKTIQADSAQKLSLQIPVRVKSTSLSQELYKRVRIQLLRKGDSIAETILTFKFGPSLAGKNVVLPVELEVPFDAPTGICSIALPDAGAKPLVIGKVFIKGMFPALKPHQARLRTLVLKSPANLKAGSTWKFSVSVTPTAKLARLPEKLVVRLEFAPHVAYIAQTYDITKYKNWTVGRSLVLGPFEMKVPIDLPAGKHIVQAAVVGETYTGKNPRSLAIGSVNVISKSTQDTTSLKPMTYGTFVDSTGLAHAWYSTPGHAVIWDGKPLLPVSGMFNGPYMSFGRTPETFKGLMHNVEIIKKQGLDHLYLFTQGYMEALPAKSWETIMDYMESVGMNYVIGHPYSTAELTSRLASRVIRANPAIALTVKNVKLPGESTRIITTGELGYPLWSVKSCQAIAVKPDGMALSPVDAKIVKTDDKGVYVSVAFDSAPEGEYTVVYCPQIEDAGSYTQNPWADWQRQVKHAKEYLAKVGLRPGFRGFIDMILPNERGLYNQSESLFFEEPKFTADRANWLKTRYKTIGNLAKAWALVDRIPADFLTAARLYPAFSDAGPNGDIMYLTDPIEKVIYSANSKKTAFWYEYIEHRDESYGRYQDLICSAMRDYIDAPISIKRCALTKSYQSNPNRSDRGLDGAGYEIYSVGDGLVNYGAGSGYVEMLQAKKQMVGSSTEFAEGFSADKPANWPDLPIFFYDLSVAQYMCGKSTYLFLYDVIPEDLYARNRILYDYRTVEWMGVWKRLVDEHAEAIANFAPIVYTSWPVVDPWWANPSERVAVGSVSDAPGVNHIKASNGIWVLPVFDALTPAPVTFVTLVGNPGTSYHAKEFEKLIAKKDRLVVFLGLRKNLGALSIDKYYTPETFEIDGDVCQVLKPASDCKVLEKDSSGRVWSMQAGKLQIVARQSKTAVSLESVVQYAKVPDVDDSPNASATNFLGKLMGVKSFSIGRGKFKGVAFTEKGKPTLVIPSTSREGGETLEITVPDGKSIEVYSLSDPKAVQRGTAGSTIKITLPAGPGADTSKGPGLGAAVIVGLKPEELRLTGLSLDAPASSNIADMTLSAVPEGCELPAIILPPRRSYSVIDSEKAAAALSTALYHYNKKNNNEAQRVAEEWVIGAPNDLLPSFNLLLGNIYMLTGDSAKAKEFYRTGLKHAPKDAALHCGLGVALLADGDKISAKSELEQAASSQSPVAETAKKNLESIK